MRKFLLCLCLAFFCTNVYSKNCWCGLNGETGGQIRFDWSVKDGEKCSSASVGKATRTFESNGYIDVKQCDISVALSYCY